MKNTILFLPNNQKITVSQEDHLLAICQKEKILLDGSCAGNGTCGKCKVQILDGVVGPLTAIEEKALTEEEKREGYRLACQLVVQSDLKVWIPDIHGSSNRKKSMNGMPADFVIDPSVKKTFLKLKKATLEEAVSELEQLAKALKVDHIEAEARNLIALQQAIAAKRRKVTSVMYGDRLITAEAEDSTEFCYGIAFDIGTTTVVGSLWNLNTGEMIDIEANTNPQSMYGSDVISRIGFCIEEDRNEKEGTARMHNLIIACMNDMIDLFCKRNELSQNHIYDMTVAGNTTMMHLFLGIAPASLAKVPFAPVYHGEVAFRLSDLGIHGNPLAMGYALPNIAGHVGADITGVMLATDLFHLQGNTIAIDIGTNGEILVASGEKVLACSTAAGPAFEGACIQHGMRAAKGAIERVSISDDVSLSTIENAEPCGICGSGLIDLMAQMLDCGIIETNGNLLSKDMARERGISERIAERLYGENQDKGFILYQRKDGSNIVITQKDIREVQLAKGAILGGMKTLMKKLDVDEASIDRVLIAGAFGSYIDKSSALRIGLLPAVSQDKVHSIGNGAGVGVAMALLNKQKRAQAEEEVKRVEHIELSQNADFEEYYIQCMNF